MRLFLFLLLASFPSAYATSTGRPSLTSRSDCAVTAKFVSARIHQGKVVWLFSRLGETRTSGCENLSAEFEVRIPSGSYSELAEAIVYPNSITEPRPGAEISLELEKVRFKTGESAWLIR